MPTNVSIMRRTWIKPLLGWHSAESKGNSRISSLKEENPTIQEKKQNKKAPTNPPTLFRPLSTQPTAWAVR